MNGGKTDIWMPLYIGDYLADTMELTTEQHGAYLLLIFHLWRRGTLPDDDAALAMISKLTPAAWQTHREKLAKFFHVNDGTWTHGRVDRERAQAEARSQANAARAQKAAANRWPELADTSSSTPQGMLEESKSQSPSQSPSKAKAKAKEKKPSAGVSSKRAVDARHTPFRRALAEYWQAKNSTSPEMPWQGRDAKALSELLSACPQLNEEQFRKMLTYRARSAVAHGDRVFLWIANVTRFQEEITAFHTPVSAGGGSVSRAEINRATTLQSLERALAAARSHVDRPGDTGTEPPGFAERGMPAADGGRPARCALDLAGSSHSRLAEGNAAHGPAIRDGPFPYGATATVTGGVAAPGG